MKFYFAALLALTMTNSALAFEDDKTLEIDCQSTETDLNHAKIKVFSKANRFENRAVAHYNYSTALMTCPRYVKRSRIEQRFAFKCAGLWMSDVDRNRSPQDPQPLDTVVVAEFVPVGEDDWETTFTTSVSYGSKKVTMSCTVHE